MSKSDAMRAMREARYAGTTAAVPTRRAVTAPAPSTAAEPPTPEPKKASPKRASSKKAEKPHDLPVTDESAATEPATGVEKCGHRSMNGRSCTREAGHAEKNHRYS